MFPFGPFDLESPLARGGTCEVWRGVHRSQGIPVAVKLGHSERARSERFARNFREEVRSVARLHHPGIIKVFDYGVVTHADAEASQHRLTVGSPYMVMEMAEGTLLALCGRCHWWGLYRILMSILDGLAHAHARGVIHRDIKPGNVLLVGHPAHIRLADFGLAQPVDTDELPRGRHGLLGTPSYMAPEQFELRWRDCWPWTDLYAVGCTAYALVCGHPPFGLTRDLEEMKEAQLTKPPPPFPEGADVVPGFESWVMRLLQKDPALRFRRAADAAWALSLLHNEWLASGGARQSPRGEMPFALSPEGTYVFHFGDRSVVTPSQGPSVLSPMARALSGEFSFHPEMHVDSLDEVEAVSSAEETTWVDSFGFGAASDSGAEEDEDEDEQALRAAMLKEELPPFPVDWDEIHPTVLQQDPRLDAVGLGIFGLREIPMVGRAAEREMLTERLRSVFLDRKAQAIILSGPEGCGKSRLAFWLCARAHEVGVATYVKATHQASWSPTSGLGPMVSRYMRCPGLPRNAIEARLRRGLEAMRADWGGAREDAIILTEMISPAEHDPDADANDGEGSSITFSHGTERHTAVGRFLERLCGRRVAIAWLDDIQWGFETLEFVHAFLERQKDCPSPVLLVLTVQPEELLERPDEAGLLEGLAEREDVATLEVGPLDGREQPLFFQRLLPLQPALSAEVEARAAGYPSFAIRLLEDWIERDVLTYKDDGFGLRPGEKVEIPDSLHELWGERIERLLRRQDPNARIALELAAVLGHDVNALEWEMVCQEAGIGIDKAWVDALFEHRLALCEHGDPSEGWSFVHSMCREALERGAEDAGRLQGHHQICADVLHQRSGELLSFQSHISQRAHGSPWPGGRPELAERVGRHLLGAGREKEALAPLLQGIWARIEAGDYRMAWRLLADWELMLERVDIPLSHPFWGESWLLRCRHARGTGKYKEAMDWATRAATEARRHGWDRVLIRALMQLGYLHWFHAKDADETREGWRCLEEARNRARAWGDRWAVARCHRYMGDFLCYRGELQMAGQHFHDAFEGFKSIRDRAGMGHACYGLATVERQAGRDAMALAQLDAARQLFTQSGSRRGIADCLNAKGDLLRHQGALSKAEDCYRESIEICQALGDGNLALGELNIGLVLSAKGEYEQAKPILERAKEAFQKGERQVYAGAASVCLLPSMAAAQEWDGWDEHIDDALTLLVQAGAHDVDTAETAQLAGNMALKAGQVERARKAYELALMQWDGLGRQREVDELIRALDGLPV